MATEVLQCSALVSNAAQHNANKLGYWLKLVTSPTCTSPGQTITDGMLAAVAAAPVLSWCCWCGWPSR